MSIILGALSGLGEGVSKIAADNTRLWNEEDLNKQRAELEQQKAESLAKFNQNLKIEGDNKVREAQVGRVNDAQQSIIQQAIADKANKKYEYTDADGKPSAATYDELPDEDKDAFGLSEKEKREAYTKAAIQTGDISPSEAAKLSSQSDIAELKSAQAQQAVQARLEAANNRTEMMGAIAQMRIEAAQARGGADGKLPSDGRMIEYLVQQGMDRKEATDRVMGTGAGATKDPVAMSATLASALIANGAVKVEKNDPPGTTIASKAMQIASGQIKSAEDQFRPGRSAPAPVAPSATPDTAPPARPPLSSFRK